MSSSIASSYKAMSKETVTIGAGNETSISFSNKGGSWCLNISNLNLGWGSICMRKTGMAISISSRIAGIFMMFTVV